MVFKFRLDKVLFLRREELETAQQNLAHALTAVEKLKKQIISTKEKLAKTNQELLENNYKMAEAYLRLIKKINEKLKKEEKDLKIAENHVSECRKVLVIAKQKVETLEKLKEKKLEEYKEEMNRIEQKETDEKVSLRFAMELQEKARAENDFADS